MSQQILVKPQRKFIERPPKQVISSQQNTILTNTQTSTQQNLTSSRYLSLTPQKRVHEELISVQNIVDRVRKAFESRENETNYLINQLSDKEKQLQYLEKQTRDHSKNLAQYSANIHILKTKLFNLENDANIFNETNMEETKSKNQFLDMEADKAKQMLTKFENNLIKMESLKNQLNAYVNILEYNTNKMNEILYLDKQTIDKYENEIFEIEEFNKELNTAIENLDIKRSSLVAEGEYKKKELENLNKEYDKQKTISIQNEEILKSLQDDLEIMKTRSKERESDYLIKINKLNDNIDHLKEYCNNVNIKIKELRELEFQKEKEYNSELTYQVEINGKLNNLKLDLMMIEKQKEEVSMYFEKLSLFKDNKECNTKELEKRLQKIQEETMELDIKNETHFKQLAKGMHDLHEIRKSEPALLWELQKLNKDLEMRVKNVNETKTNNVNLLSNYKKNIELVNIEITLNKEISLMSKEDFISNKIRYLELNKFVCDIYADNLHLKNNIEILKEDTLNKQNLINEINNNFKECENKRLLIQNLEKERSIILFKNSEIKSEIKICEESMNSKLSFENLTISQKELFEKNFEKAFNTMTYEYQKHFESEKNEIEKNINAIDEKSKEIERKKLERLSKINIIISRKNDLQFKISTLKKENETLAHQYNDTSHLISKQDNQMDSKKTKISNEPIENTFTVPLKQPDVKTPSLSKQRNTTMSKTSEKIESVNNDWFLEDDIFLGLK